MPPATYTEAPALRDERIGKHLAQCREYWLKCPAYLEEGDLCQAGEKAWAAVAQLTKAVATDRGWRHFRHADLLAAPARLRTNRRFTGIRRIDQHRPQMHANFYEVDLDRADTELGMARAANAAGNEVAAVTDAVHGGMSLAEWLAEADNRVATTR